ncbi:MAG: ParB/RepB/Spo0J family partition protein [Planctomycetota bacterium]
MTKDRRLGRGLAALLSSTLGEEPTSSGTTGAAPGAAQIAANAPGVAQIAANASGVASGMSGPMAGASLALGSGLGSGTAASLMLAAEASSGTAEGAGELLQLRVDEIEENPFQPRRDFSEEEIASLSESLKEHDLLQPILVRQVAGRYQLISGERRLRAATRAGWKTIPARLRQADDRLVAELAIVENLQRKDLNPVEKALSFKRYLDQHDCTQDELARRLKLDRSTIANLMRLLELPSTVLDALRTGLVSAGHARALLPLDEPRQQLEMCERIAREGLSVRDVERMVGEQLAREDEPKIAGKISGSNSRRTRSDQVASLEQELRAALGTKVEIRTAAKGRGKIVIHFGDHDEFDRLWDHLTDTQPPTRRSAAS